jgi:hypothetical protein
LLALKNGYGGASAKYANTMPRSSGSRSKNRNDEQIGGARSGIGIGMTMIPLHSAHVLTILLSCEMVGVVCTGTGSVHEHAETHGEDEEVAILAYIDLNVRR